MSGMVHGARGTRVHSSLMAKGSSEAEDSVPAQALSRVRLFVSPGTAAHQAPLSFTVSRSLLTLMPSESAVLSNHTHIYG